MRVSEEADCGLEYEIRDSDLIPSIYYRRVLTVCSTSMVVQA